MGYGAPGIRTEGPDHRRVGRKFGEIFLETQSESFEESGQEDDGHMCTWSGAEAVSVYFVRTSYTSR